MDLFPSSRPLTQRVVRNGRTILLEILLFAVLTVLLPVLIVAALVVDAVRRVRTGVPFTGVRLVLVAWWFLAGEMRGLLGLLGVWLLTGGPFSRDSPRRRALVWRLQSMWAGGHMNAVRLIFGLRIEVEGDDLVTPGPIVALVRHASIIDNALPAAFVTRPHRLQLRYVLKRELQALPTLDIGGHWVPTYFVRRGSGDAEIESANVGSLGRGLRGSRDGALIFPEGTRYTAPKLAKVQEKLRETDPEIGALAAQLRHVLPPRLGGPVALLAASADTRPDVLIVGHVGFDGFETVGDIWSGRLVGRTIRVRFWRHDGATVPEGRDELVRWLYARWQDLDDWIDEQRRLDPSSTLPPKAAAAAGVAAPSADEPPAAVSGTR